MNGTITGEIRIFAGPRVPTGWMLCQGQELPIESYQALFIAIGTAYGGDGKTTFRLPDMRGRVPVASGDAPFEFASSGSLNVGDGGNVHPYEFLAVNYIIKL